MKRLLAIMLAVSYLCLSIGITVHIHYCMGQLVGISLVEHEDDHHCPKCGMDKSTSKSGCCKDEHKVFKSSGDQLQAKVFLAKVFFGEYIPSRIGSVPRRLHLPVTRMAIYALPNAPPERVPSCPIYIRLRNFRV